MSKVAVIGDYNSICGFSAIGFHTIAVDSKQEARDALEKLITDKFAIIYMTENFFFEVNSKECVVLPLPVKGTGLGEGRIGKFIEQAVGSKL